uniref:Uncharacterized protein n=1 Tax=Timema poppense TaxID=170557 RepID=A0A7R9D6F5_TIMPO|nr:unnamed protein product [Timema poppensis]
MFWRKAVRDRLTSNPGDVVMIATAYSNEKINQKNRSEEESNMDIFMKKYQECKQEAGTPKPPSMGAPPKPPGPPNPNECPEDEDEKVVSFSFSRLSGGLNTHLINQLAVSANDLYTPHNKALTCTLVKMGLIKDKGMDAEKAKKMCSKMSPDQKKEFDSGIDKVEKKVGKQNTDEDAAKIMCSEAAKGKDQYVCIMSEENQLRNRMLVRCLHYQANHEHFSNEIYDELNF